MMFVVRRRTLHCERPCTTSLISTIAPATTAGYNLLIDSVVVFGHFQRPSVAMNITIEEFVRAKTASDGGVIVLVSDHKTGAQGPAQITLELPHYKLFQLYSKRSVTTHLLVRHYLSATAASFVTIDQVCYCIVLIECPIPKPWPPTAPPN